MEGQHEENNPRGEERTRRPPANGNLILIWLKQLRSGIPKLEIRVMGYDVIKPS